MAAANSSTIVVDVPEARQIIKTINNAKSEAMEACDKLPPASFSDSVLKGYTADAALEAATSLCDELKQIAAKCDGLISYMTKAIDEYQRSDASLSRKI